VVPSGGKLDHGKQLCMQACVGAYFSVFQVTVSILASLFGLVATGWVQTEQVQEVARAGATASAASESDW
jgi:hypothetical protein